MLNELRCRQCGATELRDLGAIPSAASFAGQELEPPWPGGRLLACQHCALAFRHPLMPPDEYRRLYASAPAQVWSGDECRIDRLKVLQAVAAHAKSGTVLDIGCFDGSLLAALGPTYSKFGVEPSAAARAVAEARGVRVIADWIEDLRPGEWQFDVITLVDVIEHVPDPRALLLRLIRLLAPTGVVIVSTGSIDADAWRRAGGRYWYCGIPEHISFVGRAWAEHLARNEGLAALTSDLFPHRRLPAEKREAGARIVKRGIEVSNLKLRLAALLPIDPSRKHPRHSFGEPGLFDDHVLIQFRFAHTRHPRR